MSKIYVDEIAGKTASDTVAIPGHVIQTVGDILDNTGNFYNTSQTTYQATGHYFDITPSSVNSRILVFCSGTLYGNTSGIWYDMTIQRTVGGSTTDLRGSGEKLGGLYTGGGDEACQVSVSFLDSPATTSSVRYEVYVKTQNSSGSVFWGVNGSRPQFVLQEIAG